jgi:DNA topoisomerase II
MSSPIIAKTASKKKTASTTVGKTEESTALAQQYQQKTDKQHILENPDTYIGSVENVDANLWVLPDDSNGRIVLKQIEYIPGLYKLFDEGIVNARDHVIRMIQKISSNSVPDHRAVSYIETTIDDDGTITFANDGNGIDVAKHPEYDLWIPEMIFGHLRTSTNYNTDEKRIVGGKNGFGFKLVLIWSTYGKIETVDHVRGLKYTQEFHNNLDTIDPPTIKAAKSTKPYTRVSFKPDYTRFGMPGGLTPDMLALFRKRICDIAAVTDHSIKKIKVSLNGMAMPVHNFQQYIDLYIGKVRGQGTNAVKGTGAQVEADDVSVVSNGTSVGQGTEAVGVGQGQGTMTTSAKRVYEEASERWEYAVALSPTHQFEQISFVNGICTHKGGKHVDYVLGQITRKVAAYIEKKKKITVNTNTIKEQLMLFLRCDIENPAFDSQTKDFMNTPSNKFGSSCVISDAFIEKVAKMGVMDAACSLTEIKERGIAARKTDGVKTRTIRGIANFIDANHAGTAQSKDCILILCEGLSAMSGVVSGLSSTDRNQYGIYPLKGKLLNVRGENIKKISENKEITDLKKILGLETGKEYASVEDVHKHLRYGKVMILCDQDVDGSHIKALCVNLFQSEWASLFRISGFLAFMNTPILRAKKGAQSHVFYNEGEYETWKAQPGHATGWTIKYFKGLGTSTSAEFKEYFANKKIVDFTYQKLTSDETVDKVFNKKRADERKTWLENYDKDIHLDTTHSLVKYEDFVNKELIHFSVYDCERSIPNLVDGLKTSLRKILYCAFKRRLTTEVKVAQFSGYVSEHSEYHHGEASLNGAIVGMAQNYMGSNNINLLLPNGQFGTRMMGGDDSASERYIFTQLNALTRALFPEQDDPILHYLNEDGTMIEPEYYVPILPMVLVNGISGIGTGFSSSIPPFHPMRIVDYLRHKLNGVGSKPDIQFVPYYENFKGVVAAVPDETNKYSIKGVYEKIGEDQIRITELPVGTWTMPYLTFLEGLVDGGVDKQGKKIAPTIKDFVSNSTEKFVDIQVTFQKGRLAELEAGAAGGVEKVLKLATTVSTTNMHLFDAQCKLHKYGSVEEIIDAFCAVRLDTYAKRKAHQMADMERILVKLTNKARYIQCVLEDSIDLRRKTSEEIDALLMSKDLVKISNESGGAGYDYLIKMPMVSVSKENVAKLMKEKGDTEVELATLRATTIEQMWLRELATFEEQYGIYVNKRAQEYLTKTEAGPKTVLKKKTVSAKK